jgi:hypothetical protein
LDGSFRRLFVDAQGLSEIRGMILSGPWPRR